MTSKMKGILPRMHAKAHHWPCQILYNPHWQKEAGLAVGEEHEQVFSKLSLYGYVTKHMSKANRTDLLSAAILYWNWGKIERMPSILSKRLKKGINKKKWCITFYMLFLFFGKASKCVAVYNDKLTSLLNSNQCNIEDLPEILKELKAKALANLGSRQNRKTPIDKLKRNLEGLFIHMKNVSIFISTQADDLKKNLTYYFPQLIVKLQLDSCKTRTKFRGVLTKIKGKAVKLLSVINSKYRAIHGIISMEDFEKGIFPWDLNSEDDSENESSILSLSQKYELVDTWMLLQRAEEEIKLCKMEMKEYILYLDSARSSLNRNLIDQNISCEETNQFIAGKAILMRCEIARLDVKIQESLEKFQLYSEDDFIRLTQC
ncbi:Uncharacterized protein APZ42_001434 [Daphnia magna]|uniref:Uncharacterized protein n=1 Tax=Daphnia magna TaxID=35525 RepID=A0A164IZN3_9CRUS|nr:Uncharacterized protein APZ42_001434 [Daphnia magna]